MVAPTGRTIERFTAFERAAHTGQRLGFLRALAISGLVMAFGKFFLLPVIGNPIRLVELRAENAHNFAGPLFAVSLVIVIATLSGQPCHAKKTLPGCCAVAVCCPDMRCPRTASMLARKRCLGAGVFVLGLVVVGSGWCWTN